MAPQFNLEPVPSEDKSLGMALYVNLFAFIQQMCSEFQAGSGDVAIGKQLWFLHQGVKTWGGVDTVERSADESPAMITI